MNIRDLVILVSGGASGLGLESAIHFQGLGAKVVIMDLNQGEVERQASGHNFLGITADITKEDWVINGLKKIRQELGGIQALVHCAGIVQGEKIISKKGLMPLENFSKVIEVNLIGTFNMLRLAAQEMVNFEPNEEGERGVLILTSSIAAFEGQIGQSAYAASKGGVASLILPAARELSSFGIRVNGIAPGLFHTPLLSGLKDEAIQGLSENIPFPKRLGKPQEFAKLAQHIIENPYINGEIIRIDGGLRMQAR